MTSILGKRARSAIGSTRDAIINNLTADSPKRASLRARGGSTATADEEPPLKKRKSVVPKLFSFAEDKAEEKPKSKSQQLKRKKRWLRQGLYAGQKQDFDVKKPMGKSKDKDKDAAMAKNATWALALPMFGFLDRERDFLLPFDIFNALPKGQPKPDEWKKTRSNQFVGDSKEVWRHMNSKMEQSTCTCTREQGCDENCLNADMYYECDDSNCSIGPEFCKNRQFASLKERVKSGKKFDIGVEVQKYPNKGFGVRACRTFEPFQIIVEYSGEIITQEEALDRMEDKYKGKEACLDFYFMTFDQNMICDATRGSIARFVNHSCAPNCAMVKWTVGNKPRMALFAGEEGIMTGEELTYDYNFDPFSMKNVQTCHCGASNCRGILGPRPKQVKVLEVAAATVNATVKGVKRKMTELVSGAVGKASASPVKRGTIRGPYKKRRVSAPVPLRKATVKSSPKRGRKGQGVASGASDKTLVDKENKTPSGRSSSSSSMSMAQDSVTRKSTASLKRQASGMSLKSTQSTLEAWFRTPNSVIRRAITQTPLGGPIGKAANDRGKVKKRMSMPARLPGSRTSSRLAENDNSVDEVKDAVDDGWVDNGVKVKGQWKYVPVVE